MAPQGPHAEVTAEALRAMYEHAGREYPNECCGIVFGAKAAPTADRVRACRNIQNDLHAQDPATHTRDARTAYNLDASDIFALQKSLRGDQPAKIVYHSHVEVGAYFSDTDQAAARFENEPTYPVEYVVIDASKDGARGAAQFAWDPATRSYVEVRRYPGPTDLR
ncbi:MAG TPA: Mov34/MPN/PAD-1 family protein [Polyangia bacterium]